MPLNVAQQDAVQRWTDQTPAKGSALQRNSSECRYRKPPLDSAQDCRTMSSRSRKTTDLEVAYRAVSTLIPYARNPRTHSDAQVAEIAASIREFGFTNPILVDGENGIIAGHGRLLAARKLGMKTVPVIELAGMSEAQKRAYIIADNKLALNAGWDNELLGLELGELQGLGFDLALTGFSEEELAGLLSLGNGGAHRSGRGPSPPRRAGQPGGRPLASRLATASSAATARRPRTSPGCSTA